MLSNKKSRRGNIYVYSQSRRPGSHFHAVTEHLRPRIYVGFGIFAVLVLSIGLVLVFNRSSSGEASNNVDAAATDQKSESSAKPQPKPIDEVALQTEINKIISDNPDLYIGVVVHDLALNNTYTYGVDESYIAASVSKLITASYYLKEVENGHHSLDESINDTTAQQQLINMISKSDNTAWKALNDILTHPALKSFTDSLQLASYDPENNEIKPSDVSKLITALYSEQILNHDHTQFLLANMRQDLEQEQFIRKYIDPEVTVYHKAGWLNDRAHDTAIIELPGRNYSLVIFTKSRSGNYDFNRGQEIFKQITTAVNSKMAQQ